MLLSRTHRSLINVATSAGMQICVLLLNFAVRSALVVGLGQYYLGLNSVMTSLIAIFSLAELGLGNAITYSMYKPLANKERETVEAYLRLYKIVYRIIGVAIAVIAVAAYPLLPVFLNTDVTFEITAIYALFAANTSMSYLLFAYRGTLMQANQEKYLVSIADFVFAVSSSVGQILCFMCFSSYILGLVCLVASQALRGFVLLIISKMKYSQFDFGSKAHLDKGLRKELGKNVYAMAIGKFSDTANKNLTNIVVSSFVGLVQSGLYSNYQMVSSAINALLAQAFGAITPSVGNFNVDSDESEKMKLLFRIDFIVQWIYCTCCACIWASVNPFIEAWIGPEYLLDGFCVMGITANILIIGLLHATVIFKDGCGVFYQGRFRPLATCVLSIVLSFVLVQPFGMVGAIWAAPLSRAFTALWYDPLLVFKHVMNKKPHRYYVRMLSNMGMTVLVSFLCGWACSVLPGSSWMLFSECVAVSFALSQICLIVRYRKDPSLYFCKELALKLIGRAGNAK